MDAQPTDSPHAHAIQSLQESHAFLDHKVDQLAEQLLVLNRKIDEFTRRLAVFETRISTFGPQAPSITPGSDSDPTTQG